MNPQVSFLLDKSLESLRNSNLESAELYLKQALRLQSTNPHALRFLGIIAAQRGRHSEALLYFKDSLKSLPKNPLTLSNLGNVFLEQNEYSNALDAYDKALKIDPKYEEAWSNKGLALHELKRFDEAIAHYDKALSLKSDYARAWSNKGITLKELKRHDEAIAHYDKALSLRPDYAEVWSHKGIILHELKRHDEAIAHYDKALSLRPDYAEVWSNKGLTLHELKRYHEAIAYYDEALILKPDYARALSNKGITLNELKRHDEAIAHYDKAISLRPDFAEGWSNKGVTLHELRRYDEAITHYDKALSLKSDYAEGWSNKGVTLHELKRFDEAITHYDKALSLKSDYHEASLNKSLSLLLQGDFENGFLLYENRWASEKMFEIAGRRFFDKPTWLGKESLQGKTILLYGEQGFGDFIQFCRYIKLVSDLGAKVILEVPQSLASLLENLEGVSQLVIKDQDLPFFDYQCPLLSLPLAFNTNIFSIPAYIPYLASSAHQLARWKLKLGEKRNKRVGLAWSSMSGFKEDSKRSLLLADLVSALPLEGFEYICLQKELKECDKEFFRSYQNIRFFGDEFRDFSDTAALIENLDLVISTCTSVPHLSAALGKETWVLLSHVPDWRWLLCRDDSPWYPSMKLYRQTSIGDWKSVLDRVKSDLSIN
jgi:tetratricopeptide (TPR) repeat protein